MDPNVAASEAVNGMSVHDRIEAAEALATWLRRGGYLPDHDLVADILREYAKSMRNEYGV